MASFLVLLLCARHFPLPACRGFLDMTCVPPGTTGGEGGGFRLAQPGKGCLGRVPIWTGQPARLTRARSSVLKSHSTRARTWRSRHPVPPHHWCRAGVRGSPFTWNCMLNGTPSEVRRACRPTGHASRLPHVEVQAPGPVCRGSAHAGHQPCRDWCHCPQGGSTQPRGCHPPWGQLRRQRGWAGLG